MRHCLLTLALGGDLFSKFISYSDDPDFIASGQLLLSFDFLWTNTGATTWAGTDHQTSGFGDEQWRWNSAGGALHGTNPPANTWVHVAFRFKPEDSGNVGSIVLKFEQNSGTAGTSYFDNIRLAAGAGAVLTGVALARNHVPEFDKIFVANAGSAWSTFMTERRIRASQEYRARRGIRHGQRAVG